MPKGNIKIPENIEYVKVYVPDPNMKEYALLRTTLLKHLEEMGEEEVFTSQFTGKMTGNKLRVEIEKQSTIGQEFVKQLLMLTIDLLLRDKVSIKHKQTQSWKY